MKIYYEIILIPMMIPSSLMDYQMLNQIYQYLKNQAVIKKVEKKSDSEPENDTEWTDLLRVIHVEQFNQEIGQVFPANFDEQTVTPKDYFDLMLSPGIIWDFVRHTNSYAQWKMEQKGEDSVWYNITEPEMSTYLGINQLLSYKDYWSKDLFFGNEGTKSVMTVQRYEKFTEYFHVSDRIAETAHDTWNYD